MSHSEEVTLADPLEQNHVRIETEDFISEVEAIDPRITPSERADEEQLDEGYVKQMGDYMHGKQHNYEPEKGEGPLYVEFEKGDKRNPINFTRRRKAMIAGCAIFFTVLSAANAATYNMGFPSMTRDLNCTEFQATIGLSMYTLGFALVPLVAASFSEEFGRMPMYLGSIVGVILTHVMVALAKNIHTVQIARFFAGGFASTGSTLVGGTIADIYLPHERGKPMSIFSIGAIGFTGLGATAAGWIEMNHHLQWRWIQWISLIVTGVYALTIPVLMKETRSGVLLTRIAKKLRKETGNKRYRARVEDERDSLRVLIWVSCTRPLYLLATEPVVTSFSIWVGFAWGILYILIESIGPIFRDLHHFSSGAVGTVFVTFLVGSLLGHALNMVQERVYKRNVATRGPEARLYGAMAAAVSFPVGLFIYAWCSFPYVPWIALCIAITVIMLSCFLIYLAVFTYLADCYGPFASSALAGQSLSRSLFGMAFPLFSQQMFAKLTYPWGNTLFALIAVVMIPTPYILFFMGPKLRASSKFASTVMKKA